MTRHKAPALAIVPPPSIITAPAPLLTVERTAEILGVAPNTLSDWRYKKVGLPFVKLGSRVMYAPDDVAAFIEAHKTAVDPLEDAA